VEEGYATPLFDDLHLIGATYQAKTILPDQEEIDTEALLSAARKWPEFKSLSREQVRGTKTGYRLSTPDKLPMIGPLCDPDWLQTNYSRILRGAKSIQGLPLESPPGEWLLTGLGSRGITYSSLGSEILAEWMTGNPIPLEQDLLEHIHSSRFFVRKLRKAEVE
jgi:tRNA 5-methylaminomethyl-2-thiouridine biosynthesis bifunctional protein